jgi:hypothetical protein
LIDLVNNLFEQWRRLLFVERLAPEAERRRLKFVIQNAAWTPRNAVGERENIKAVRR